MDLSRIKQLIIQGEGRAVEFKSCTTEISNSFYETVCSFLNREGGEIVLGIDDDGNRIGVSPQHSRQLMKNIVTCLNDGKKLFPPVYLIPELVMDNDKHLLYLQVPCSSQAHQTAGKYFDRNEDTDLDITLQQSSMEQLYLRKQQTYTEAKIYPYVGLQELRHDLIAKVRSHISNTNPSHPWSSLNDMEMLSSAGLYRKDYQTGQVGFTLAAVLLLGEDTLIRNILPAYRTDAVLRVSDLDRYDDRDDIRTNLIEAYDRLMAFVRKHLPDPFHLEGDQRISLRDTIFREVVANLLVHREYTVATPARLVIESAQVVLDNANRPHYHGPINPRHFSPYPKNPLILQFFRHLGRVDELGSGVRNTFKYTAFYAKGHQPELIEGPVFKAVIPIPVIKNGKSGHSKLINGHSKLINGHSIHTSGHLNTTSGHSNQHNEALISENSPQAEWENAWKEVVEKKYPTVHGNTVINHKTGRPELVVVTWIDSLAEKALKIFGGPIRIAHLPEQHETAKQEFRKIYIELQNKEKSRLPISEEQIQTYFSQYQLQFRRDYHQRVESILLLIFQKEGHNAPKYAEDTGFNLKSTRKYINTLLQLKLIEAKGKSKQKGYFLTRAVKEKLGEEHAD